MTGTVTLTLADWHGLPDRLASALAFDINAAGWRVLGADGEQLDASELDYRLTELVRSNLINMTTEAQS